MSDKYEHLHPRPVPDGVGGEIYIYRADALNSDRSDWVDTILDRLNRYVAYSKPYPAGPALAYAHSVGRAIRKARRVAAQKHQLRQPVDVSAYTGGDHDGD